MNAALEIDPSWLRVDNIERRAGLTPDEFVAQYETPGIPVVLTDVMDSWRAKSEWTPAQLRNKSQRAGSAATRTAAPSRRAKW